MVSLAKWVDAQIFKQVKRLRPCYAYVSNDDLALLLNHEKMRQLLGNPSETDLSGIAGAVGARYLMALTVEGRGSEFFIRGSTIDMKTGKVLAKRNPYANNPDEAVDVVNEFAAEPATTPVSPPQRATAT